MKHPKKPGCLSPPMPDQKYAYVQLKEGQFTFPKLFEASKIDKYEKDLKTMETIQNQAKNKYINRLDIGGWFA